LTFTLGRPEAFRGVNVLLMASRPTAIRCVVAALHICGVAAVGGAEPLPETEEIRQTRFASFWMTASTQAPTAEDTVDWSSACAPEPPFDDAPDSSDVGVEGEGPLLSCEAEEGRECESPEHAARSGAAASKVAAAAQPMTLLPDSGRAMTFYFLTRGEVLVGFLRHVLLRVADAQSRAERLRKTPSFSTKVWCAGLGDHHTSRKGSRPSCREGRQLYGEGQLA